MRNFLDGCVKLSSRADKNPKMQYLASATSLRNQPNNMSNNTKLVMIKEDIII